MAMLLNGKGKYASWLFRGVFGFYVSVNCLLFESGMYLDLDIFWIYDGVGELKLWNIYFNKQKILKYTNFHLFATPPARQTHLINLIISTSMIFP
jgi:hypothetical protein